MAFQLSEAQIVDHIWNQREDDGSIEVLGEQFVLKNKHAGSPFQLRFHREKTLASGKRIDIYGETKNKRVRWAVEFKIHASADALVQVDRYATELGWERTSSRLFFIQRTIIAQSFDADSLYLAKKLGIQVLQFNLIARRLFELRPVVQLHKHGRRGLLADSEFYIEGAIDG